MSILISLYTRAGIVYAADRNLTWGPVVFPDDASKVLLWPYRRAILGVVGLGELEEIQMDEWLRIFIAETRDYETPAEIAGVLLGRVQHAFNGSSELMRKPRLLIIQIGGFEQVNGVATPVNHMIRNVESDRQGGYTQPETTFRVDDMVRHYYEGFKEPSRYPEEVRERFEVMERERGHVLHFTQGHKYGMFQHFVGGMYSALKYAKGADSASPLFSLEDWKVFARMSVEAYGAYFTHTRPENKRFVGDVADVRAIPWPKDV